LHWNPCGDNRFYNNIFVGHGDLSMYDTDLHADGHTPVLPVWMNGNVFFKGTKPCKHETNPVLNPGSDPAVKLVEKADGFYLEATLDKTWARQRTRKLVTTDLLGKTVISDVSFERPDGTSLKIDTDYFGNRRSEANPTPGPFENPGTGSLSIKVW
jgi:alpha-N-arabinofuranosidase